MKQNLTFIMLIFSMLLFSCKNKTAEVSEPETGLIEITKAQFESEKMEFGEPILSPFSDLVHFTGTVVPSVNGRAQISLPAQGLVSRIWCKPGQLVSKGTVLFEVSGNEFIDMQKDFAESVAMLNRLKTEYERQKELMAENIGAKKDFIQAESMYNVEKAKFNALKIKLELLGLEVKQIEEGKFYTSYSVKAPIKGIVSNINANIGQFVESQQIIAEIIDTESFQIKLSVFEKDINKVKVGQHVEYYLAGTKSEKYSAILKLVGKSINNETKSIDCFAEIESPETISLVSYQFIEGDIITGSDSVFSVPESAILKAEGENYILVLEKETGELFYFSRQKVTVGRINNGFVELTNIHELKKILIKGVYNLRIE